MKGKTPILLSALLLSAGLVSCGAAETQYSQEASGTLYLKGEQTIVLASSSSYGSIKFEEGIAKEDIVLGVNLGGKSVTAVHFVSQDEVEVTIAGTGTASESNATGSSTITVLDSGLTGSATGVYDVAYVLRAPEIACGVAIGISLQQDGSYDVWSTYTLDYGEFYADYCNADHIHTDNGTGSVEEARVDEDGQLYVSVKGYRYPGAVGYPCIVIGEACTSFHHEATIGIGEPCVSTAMIE